MATTTLKAIIDRFQLVIEDEPLSLTQTTQPFTFDVQPNATVDDRYWVEDGGLTESESQTNNAEVRMDTLIVWLASRLKLDGQSAQEAMETRLVTLERYLIADGAANSYMATLIGREMRKIDGLDALIASASFVVDYDYTLSTS